MFSGKLTPPLAALSAALVIAMTATPASASIYERLTSVGLCQNENSEHYPYIVRGNVYTENGCSVACDDANYALGTAVRKYRGFSLVKGASIESMGVHRNSCMCFYDDQAAPTMLESLSDVWRLADGWASGDSDYSWGEGAVHQTDGSTGVECFKILVETRVRRSLISRPPRPSPASRLLTLHLIDCYPLSSLLNLKYQVEAQEAPDVIWQGYNQYNTP